jgi:hypothetical protein
MNIRSDTTNVRPTTVAFTNCFNATIFGRMVHMTAREERRLRNLLEALRDYGLILRASFDPALPGYGFGDVVYHLRASIGAHVVDAAMAARDRFVPGSDPEPAAVMPVWGFEPEGGSEDVLVSSARLWGADLLVEALRVMGDDDPTPVPSVRGRFRSLVGRGRRWPGAVDGAAAGSRRMLRAFRRCGARLSVAKFDTTVRG